MSNGAEQRLLERLENHIYAPIYNPFELPARLKGELTWFGKRMIQGYFGPAATYDRSLSMDENFRLPHHSLDRIKERRGELLNAFKQSDEIQVNYDKDILIKKLHDDWVIIKKGEKEELSWTEEAVALTSAYFQYKKGGEKEIELRDNQLYYMLQLILNKGKYEFGSLETDARGVELPTGEGKTYAFNLAAGIMVLRGERVHIIEPNYISATEHAAEMGEFFFDFLHMQTGLVIDIPESPGEERKTVVRPTGRIDNIIEQKGVRKSYLFGEHSKFKLVASGKLLAKGKPPIEIGLEELSGVSGRNTAWGQQIVFCDKSSVAFDYLEGKQIGSPIIENTYGQPELKSVTAMIAEAEASMLIEASQPFVLSRKNIEGNEVWDHILDEIGLDTTVSLNELVGEESLAPEEKRQYAQIVIFSLWNALEENQHLFEQGEGKDYEYAQGNLNMSVNAIEKAKQLLSFTLQRAFPDEDLRTTWIHNNTHIINAALYVFFGMKLGRDSLLHDQQPILLDQSGFPLEKHQLHSIYHVFLQLQDHWQEWKKEPGKKENPNEILGDIITQHGKDITISVVTDRILPFILYKKYGKLRFSSGTLLSTAQSFYELYQAEVVQAYRHKKIDRPDTSYTLPSSVWIECPDGGYAKVAFLPDYLFLQQIVQRVKELRLTKRAGLIVCADIEEARALKELMPEKETILISAEEELEKRGRLADEVKTISEGNIVITTLMGARDINLKINNPEVIGVGLPADEQTLWQLLQRVVRGDLTGSRLLLLSNNHLKPIVKEYLFHSGSERLHKIRKRDFENIWNNLLADRKNSMKLFEMCLQYLRRQDEGTTKHLVHLGIRDERLEYWKETLIRRWKQERRTGGEEINLLWSSFLEDIDKIFNSFMLDTRHSTLKELDLKNAWQGYVIDKIITTY